MTRKLLAVGVFVIAALIAAACGEDGRIGPLEGGGETSPPELVDRVRDGIADRMPELVIDDITDVSIQNDILTLKMEWTDAHDPQEAKDLCETASSLQVGGEPFGHVVVRGQSGRELATCTA
jgi:hypothetical protein